MQGTCAFDIGQEYKSPATYKDDHICLKREVAMKENEFQSRLNQLLSQIDTLPESDRPKLAQLASETNSRHQRMKKTITELQDSLDHLRLSVKYLVFDLEATRRENKYLRNMLDNNAEGAD